MKDLKSLYNIALYILNNSPYGKNEPMELGLFSRLLFESEASQLLSSGLIRIKDYWVIDKKNDTILPRSFNELLSSEDYRIWIKDDKVYTDQDVDLTYISQYSKEVLDSMLIVPTESNWTIDTWYRLATSAKYKNSELLTSEDYVNPTMIIKYVCNGLINYVTENFEVEKSLGMYD